MGNNDDEYSEDEISELEELQMLQNNKNRRFTEHEISSSERVSRISTSSATPG